MPKLTRLPILFLSGEQDEVIPPEHMRKLYSTAEKSSGKGTSQPTRLIAVWKSWPTGMHNDTCLQPGYFEKIGGFVQEHVYNTARRRGRKLGDGEKEEVVTKVRSSF